MTLSVSFLAACEDRAKLLPRRPRAGGTQGRPAVWFPILKGFPMAGSRNERTGDGCTACCFTHAVVALQKPSGEWCVNCDVGAGCHIYADRPRACADFACLWIKEGLGDAHDRPDVLRVVVSAISVNVAGRHIRIVQFIETEPGAIDTVRVSAIIDNYKAGRAAVCIAAQPFRRVFRRRIPDSCRSASSGRVRRVQARAWQA